ncbi:isoaspartyl peptidase/L-asparaginase family protein [Fluviicola chungangensis]|uniref:Isoaspartyl peptidase n=1 Tax=Fluviicola chungangensis TaxID=2597671 RepID=A0A556MQJ8_9FLAO|nr:isoaspartyl peptidase/L-asparaginase [Fluviicola chungangensis]TSJ42078.1 isoaspartyl peptidase/L-asparaginase [Fluviicola chungangensis]
MNRIAIAIHGGAGQNSEFIEANYDGYMEGLRTAITRGHELLINGASALDVVEATVRILEDDPLFNAGKGSALNTDGKVEMDAAIMNGNTLAAGAVSMVTLVKNPISLARKVMSNTKHVYLAGYGALKLAKLNGLELMPEDYFIVERQLNDLKEEKSYGHGTVGCVALDSCGNMAAATSTGGLTNSLPGRVGDSCMIGAGCYANAHCACSCTGDGELIIINVIAHRVADLLELKGMPLQEACDQVICNIDNPINGDVGMISVDIHGNVAFSFNCDRMHRAKIDHTGELVVDIYQPDSLLRPDNPVNGHS